MSLVRFHNDIFTYITEKNFFASEQLAKSNCYFNLRDRSSKLYSLKIHFSLNYIAYKKYRKVLIHLLSQATQRQIIKHFKFINEDLFEEKCMLIDELNSLIPSLDEYASIQKDRSTHPQSFNIENLLILYRKYMNDPTVDLPPVEDIATIQKNIRDGMLTTLRFLISDQITIYLSPETDIYGVINLCEKINDYLGEQKAKAGMHTPTAVKISDYINLRQDYLNDSSERIDAILFDPRNPDDIQCRKQVQEEIKSSRLFHELHKRVTRRHCHESKHQHSFWAKPEPTIERSHGVFQSPPPFKRSKHSYLPTK